MTEETKAGGEAERAANEAAADAVKGAGAAGEGLGVDDRRPGRGAEESGAVAEGQGAGVGERVAAPDVGAGATERAVGAGDAAAAGVAGEDVERQRAKAVAEPEEGSAAKEEGRRPEDPDAADDVLTRRVPGQEVGDAAVLGASRKHTRRSFAVAAVAGAAGYGFYRWVTGGPADDDQPIPRRDAFRFNAALARGVTGDRALAPTYSVRRAENLRVNGVYGLKQELVPESYRLQMVGVKGAKSDARYVPDVTAWEYRYTAEQTKEDAGHDTKTPPKPAGGGGGGVPEGASTAEKMSPEPMVDAMRRKEAVQPMRRMPRGSEEAGESDSTLRPGTPGLLLTMADVLTLPRHELVTQFKCIEGWSQVVHWAGVRLKDFLEMYPPALVNGREPRYVYMETPNGDYYTGYDLQVCRHPQSLLVTEMMGAPLTQYHGAPLRLHMPTKYGYKQIKRIGLIAYMDERPDDYWTKLGYDWYAGL